MLHLKLRILSAEYSQAIIWFFFWYFVVLIINKVVPQKVCFMHFWRLIKALRHLLYHCSWTLLAKTTYLQRILMNPWCWLKLQMQRLTVLVTGWPLWSIGMMEWCPLKCHWSFGYIMKRNKCKCLVSYCKLIVYVMFLLPPLTKIIVCKWVKFLQ